MTIREAKSEDWETIWPIVREVFVGGDTFPNDPEITKEEAYRFWLELPTATYVAIDSSKIVGTYCLKPNQPGLGSHVCNAGYMVSSRVRNRGIGRAMCAHSLEEAVKLGFKAMQFNLVVSTNVKAFDLWKNMGFEVIGRLPKAFNHKDKGLVDAYVMYQWLDKN